MFCYSKDFVCTSQPFMIYGFSFTKVGTKCFAVILAKDSMSEITL